MAARKAIEKNRDTRCTGRSETLRASSLLGGLKRRPNRRRVACQIVPEGDEFVDSLDLGHTGFNLCH